MSSFLYEPCLDNCKKFNCYLETDYLLKFNIKWNKEALKLSAQQINSI